MSSINGNRIHVNPLGVSLPVVCPLAICGDGGNAAVSPIFTSGAVTGTAKTYLENATVETNSRGGLLLFGGPSNQYCFWHMRTDTTYRYFRIDADGTLSFTGQHKTQPDNIDIKTHIDEYVGKIMSSNDTGYTSHDANGNKIIGSEAIYITEALPNCSLSCIDNDPCVFGVVTNAPNNILPDQPTFMHDSDNTFENNLYSSVRVNSLGEGAMWVSNINGPIKNGDWITSSRIPGIGKRQSDEFMHNYTVAKATMSCNFDLNSDKYESKKILFSSEEYIMAYIGVTYHCG